MRGAAGRAGGAGGRRPDRFFRPPYVGGRGWLGGWLDVAVDWSEIEEIVCEAYLQVAPTRLAAELDGA